MGKSHWPFVEGTRVMPTSRSAYNIVSYLQHSILPSTTVEIWKTICSIVSKTTKNPNSGWIGNMADGPTDIHLNPTNWMLELFNRGLEGPKQQVFSPTLSNSIEKESIRLDWTSTTVTSSNKRISAGEWTENQFISQNIKLLFCPKIAKFSPVSNTEQHCISFQNSGK